MVAVAAVFCAQIFLVPVLPEQAVVVLRLAMFPAIEGFVHDQNPHTIAEVKQLRSGHVMACPQSVHPHFLENLELALGGAKVESRSECSQILMVANPIEPHAFSIEKKSFVGNKFEAADSKRRLVAIYYLAIGFDGGGSGVNVRRLKPPEPGLCKHDRGFGEARLPRRKCCFLDWGNGDDFLTATNDGRDADCGGSVGLVFDICLDPDGSLLRRHLRRGDIRPPLRHVDRVHFQQPDVAVNARAGIPTGRLPWVVEADGKHVVGSGFDVRRQI